MQNASRIELSPVSQRVQVHVDGKLLANSIQVIELREIGYPPSHYIIFRVKTYGWICSPSQKRQPTARLKAARCISR
ncbi:MAG: hypothetical protein ACTIKU_14855 [Halomonas sp.]|uniref:hypothetical protein n=1 Tax=unclassified Halomonas TaxID=2609666 RepID=UPI003CF2E398